ncbi:MAG: hypothetical protein J5943_11205 [Oribacterium sp.]|nr:hypothetical protein [Oribacterium sp.]
MQKDTQMDIIADYYMALGKYSPNEKYSESNVRVYTSLESDCWLVLERKGKNAIQARMTDETGKIISWDNYDVMNAAITQIEAIRVSVSGRSEILFTPAELRVIERYGDYDRNTTRGKLDILLDRFKDDATKESAQTVINKLGRISDKSYADLYSVRQRKMETEKVNSLENRLKIARVKADKINAEIHKLANESHRGKGIVL